MSKFFKGIGRGIYKFFRAIYRIVDKLIIMPISRLVYNASKNTSANGNFDKMLNRPKALIILSLIFAVICFVLIEAKVINLVENEAEEIKNVPVSVFYNAEKYVVEDVPDSVDIIITGNKRDINLAKQLGDFKAELDLSKYTNPGSYKVNLKCSETVGSVKYIINPRYLSVTIKDRISEVRTVNYDVVGLDNINEKLSVGSVSLDTTEVVVKGSQDKLKDIASIKALVSVSQDEFKNADTYELTNIPLVAYDNNGSVVNNIEIVPNVLTGKLTLKSHHLSVPVSVATTGKLQNGKAIASITINNSSNYAIDIYGEENDIKNISSVPVTINVEGYGSESAKTYNVTIKKPTGVKYMSTTNATITASFGDEEQKTVDVSVISNKNLAEGLSANITNKKSIPIIVKGVKSNIDKIDASQIKAYVDLSGLEVGTHEVEVKVENDNPLLNYEVASTISIQISK